MRPAAAPASELTDWEFALTITMPLQSYGQDDRNNHLSVHASDAALPSCVRLTLIPFLRARMPRMMAPKATQSRCTGLGVL
jgi:hypothetical protein